MPVGTATLRTHAAERLRRRNPVSRSFFRQEAPRLSEAARHMAGRFMDGGRLLAVGRGPYATDAQHVAVEFVHPVIVGKRALPALDLSPALPDWLRAVLRPEDIVMGFGPPEGDAQVDALLAEADARGAFTVALPGARGGYAVAAPTGDALLHQEMIELAYHTLWESVHVFLEHRSLGHDVGASDFLYPFLGPSTRDDGALVDEVAASIVMKAEEDEQLRETLAHQAAAPLAEAAQAIHERLQAGGKLLAFGNGGSATDANDFALDCVMPPAGFRPLPAVSLALEAATLTAVANDIGQEAIFLRPLIAHAQPADVAVAFSTSGGSANIMAALQEARKRGLLTVAFLGYDGGEIARRGLADLTLVVPCDYIPRIQEIHASLYHVLRTLLEDLLA